MLSRLLGVTAYLTALHNLVCFALGSFQNQAGKQISDEARRELHLYFGILPAALTTSPLAAANIYQLARKDPTT